MSDLQQKHTCQKSPELTSFLEVQFTQAQLIIYNVTKPYVFLRTITNVSKLGLPYTQISLGGPIYHFHEMFNADTIFRCVLLRNISQHYLVSLICSSSPCLSHLKKLTLKMSCKTAQIIRVTTNKC